MLLLLAARARKPGEVSDVSESGWFALIGMAISSLIAFMRLEGRVNAHDLRLEEMREDVVYIRQRIDQALNRKH